MDCLENEGSQPKMFMLVEPYWLKKLNSMIGMELIIETTQKELFGKLLEVEHDHLALQTKYGILFVRSQQVISVMPVHRCEAR
ncbi:DUF2642 domain-containing protein [Anaerosinus massiliensis]|uniref:DUF2642 domain-containing protein n=1 Tax=Massilibacillus massiliensis TaxID=1806837 RepID=UPI0018FE6088|nr:DUF2642 domain-containing protein [Massilibacillus massiliensis]